MVRTPGLPLEQKLWGSKKITQKCRKYEFEIGNFRVLYRGQIEVIYAQIMPICVIFRAVSDETGHFSR